MLPEDPKLRHHCNNEKLEKFVELCEMRTGNFHGDAVVYSTIESDGRPNQTISISGDYSGLTIMLCNLEKGP
jgi:hypothetical protein